MGTEYDEIADIKSMHRLMFNILPPDHPASR
jgi:hypothetical protein